jgi:hypothetical protein
MKINGRDDQIINEHRFDKPMLEEIKIMLKAMRKRTPPCSNQLFWRETKVRRESSESST